MYTMLCDTEFLEYCVFVRAVILWRVIAAILEFPISLAWTTRCSMVMASSSVQHESTLI